MLNLHLDLLKSSLLPGERVECTLQVYTNSSDGATAVPAVHLQELQVSSVGLERTDTNWIKHLHRSEIPGEVTNETRKHRRIMYKTHSVPLLQNCLIPPGAARQFQVRFRLPSCLPPSFKGQSCRFSYTVDAKAVYTVQLTELVPPVTQEVTETKTLTIWPPIASQPQAPMLRMTSSAQPSLHPQPSWPNSQQTSQAGTKLPTASQEIHPQPSLGGNYGSPSRGALDDRFARSSSTGSVASTAPYAGVQQSSMADGGVRVVCLDYMLLQEVKLKWKEVQADYPAIHRRFTTAPNHAETSPRTATGSPSRSSSSRTLPSTPSHSRQHSHSMRHPYPSQTFTPVPTSVRPLVPGIASAPGFRSARGSHSNRTGSQGGGPLQQPEPAAAAAAAAAALELYKAEARAAAATRSQLRGRPSSTSAAGLLDSESESSWSSDEGGNTAEAAAAWRRRSTTGPRSGQLQAARSLTDGTLKVPPTVFGHVYSLQLRDHTILRIMLQAPLDSQLQPGASFGGVVELRPGGLSSTPALLCHQLSVVLESEEVVPAECSARGGGRHPGVMRRLHSEHQEITSDLAVAHFFFSVPSGATPSFETPMVSLRWVLRFDLTIGASLPLLGASETPIKTKPSSFETMNWTLPLHVHTPL